MDLDRVLADIDANLDAAIARLLQLIAIPSVSSDGSGGEAIARAARWLQAELSGFGLPAEVVETAGHPIVLARASGGGPKLMFYGHYDVQPAEPLDAWTHPPFAPTVIDEDGVRRFYGRGASDSKSQLWSFVEALRAWRAVHGDLPGEVVVLLEGEEESGSPSLPGFIGRHRQALAADVAFICDSDMWSPTRPAITTRLKGLVHEKVTISAPNGDLHSGIFGAAAANPIRVLANILAALHAADGRVAIPGFYDDAAEIAPASRETWRALAEGATPADEVDLSGGVVEAGYSPLEAMWGRPTVDINGITGGNQGPGERSVLPGAATARLSFRLVGGQDPHRVRRAFREFVRARTPEGCTATFEGEFASAAVVLSQDNPFLAATARGLQAEWGAPPVLKGTGGNIPLVQQLKDGLGIDCVVVGTILATDAIHGPDEHFDVERFRKGARAWARVLAEIAGG